MEYDVEKEIGVASAVMQALYQTVMVKRELEVKLSIYQLIYVPHLSSWDLDSDRKNRIADTRAKISFLHMVAGLILGDRVQSTDV